jgi:hypothetical protein
MGEYEEGNAMIRSNEIPTIVMETVTDPDEPARAREQRERFERNLAWFKEHALEIFRTYRGKTVCIAGQELFVGDTPGEARAKAEAAHPEDDGLFSWYIPRKRLERIYAHQRLLTALR